MRDSRYTEERYVPRIEGPALHLARKLRDGTAGGEEDAQTVLSLLSMLRDSENAMFGWREMYLDTTPPPQS